jgi:hypothetical protein
MLQNSSLFWLAAWMLTGLPDATRVQLKPRTTEAFNQYLQTVQTSFNNSLRSGSFLWVDASSDRRSAVREGRIFAEPSNQSGDIEIPDGLIHDWTGAVFVPGATLSQTLHMVENYDNHKNIYRPEVIDSRLISRRDDDFKVYLRVLKKQVLTVVLNTEHDVHYVRLDSTRWYSKSFTTRIAEVEDPGPNEHELPPGNDHGFLWRLNSFWRFEERDGGVYLECRAISLTRDVPVGLGWLINPIIRSLPRESLTSTLRATRQALTNQKP